MRQNWWKWLGAILLAYVIIGGLILPLKTGITGVRLANSSSFEMESGVETKVEADFYNFGDHFEVNKVLLKNDSFLFNAHQISWNPDGTLTATFLPKMGTRNESTVLYTLYCQSKNKWMAFPMALSIRKGVADTIPVAADTLMKTAIDANPDLLKGFPDRPILNESIRNLLYHVPMWFSMIFLLSLAAWYAVKYLRTGNIDHDLRSDSLIRIGILAGILGCITGMVWARITWNTWWPRDPKLNGVAIGMLMYFAYLLLRAGIRDDHQKARVGAVYNLFVFPIFIALIIIMPKLAGDSLHPGAGGTVTFKQYDLDNTLRKFFYPAVIGWILLYTWVASLLYRYRKIEYKISEENAE